jgi:hypothetical protein
MSSEAYGFDLSPGGWQYVAARHAAALTMSIADLVLRSQVSAANSPADAASAAV